MRLPSSRIAWPLLAFTLVVAVDALSVNKTSWDSRWTLHTALSLVTEGNADLQEYADLLAAHANYAVEYQDGRPYNLFPLGPSLWAAPLVAVVDGALRLFAHRSYRSELNAGRWSDVEELTASFAVAWTTVLIYLIGLASGLTRPRAFVLAMIGAFATPAWSTASRALWQHGPSMLCLSLALWSLLRGGEASRRRWFMLAGFALGLSFLARPTNAVAIVAFAAYVLWRHPRQFLALALPGLAVGAGLLAYNLGVYHQVLAPYYHPDRLVGEDTFWTALAGNLVSPSRGLLVYSPVFILAPLGWAIWWRHGGDRALLVAVAATIGGHWLAISRFPHWWGGHCYGARFFSDMTPLLIFLLIPLVSRWPFRASTRPRLRQAGAALLVVVSVGIACIGANVPAALRWNVTPANVDEQPSRLWDWHDPQFMRH